MLKSRDQLLVSEELVLSFAEVTDVGGRESNQDAQSNAQQDDLRCFVMSDGVGGATGGEIASKIIVDAVISRFMEEAAVGPRALRSYIDYAALEVERRKSEEGRLRKMRATVAAVLIDCRNYSASWAHLGDTRVYLFRKNKLHSVTKDHSLVQQLVDAGCCSKDQLRTHPQRSLLCGAIGGDSGETPEVAVDEAMIEAGDAFLVCTDGFWEWISEEEMENAAASARSVREWLEVMRAVVESKARLSMTPHDNYTAFTIFVSGTSA